MYEPGYLALFENGTLEKRVKELKSKLHACKICPRQCGANRLEDEKGYCNSGHLPYVCSYCDHHGEEPPLSGTHGSGTIFLGSCNLRCVFCQNADISQNLIYPENYEISVGHLARLMLELQNIKQCHNINFVSPGHFVPQIIEAVYMATPLGLHIPLVYNSNGYDDYETLVLLEGIIDIYLPDFKYDNAVTARKYSTAKNYPAIARTAIAEMYRQVGLLKTDSAGIAQSGLIIRHLVLPNQLAGSEEILHWIANNLSPLVTVSLMAQYYPTHRARFITLLSRSLRYNEYQAVLQRARDLQMDNVLYQEMSAPEFYRPRFDKQDHPFK